MSYVDRDVNGNIISTYANPQYVGHEYVENAVIWVSPKALAISKLSELDKQYELTQRNLREFIMLTAEALKTGTPIDVTVLPGVQVVYAVEAQAAVLRAQL